MSQIHEFTAAQKMDIYHKVPKMKCILYKFLCVRSAFQN